VNKVFAIRAALRCFTCGLLSLVPVLGIPFALAALVFHTKASGHAPDNWNVARRYATLGALFAALGLVLNVTAIGGLTITWAAKQL
jgi:hypothetical protein